MAVHVSPARSLSQGSQPRRRRRWGVAGVAAVFLLSACAGSDSETSAPAKGESVVENCGLEVSPEAPPERIFALNTSSLENLLALGLEDRVVGAAATDEGVREDLRAAAKKIKNYPTGDADYPSSETILDTEPDLIYSVYPSAYRAEGGVATREELDDLGVPTYLSPGRCPDRDKKQPPTFEENWEELRELGRLTGTEDEAKKLVAEQEKALEDVRADLPDDVGDVDVFWWDMGTKEAPTAGACCGAPGMILEELGVNNAFDDLPDHWSETSWEKVADRDPDLVVIADMGDGDADKKIKHAQTDPTLKELDAFQEDKVVVVPFVQTSPGLQNVTAVETIGEALKDGSSS